MAFLAGKICGMREKPPSPGQWHLMDAAAAQRNRDDGQKNSIFPGAEVEVGLCVFKRDDICFEYFEFMMFFKHLG